MDDYIVDLHTHYPMHMQPPERYKGARDGLGERIYENFVDLGHSLLLSVGDRLFNEPKSVTLGALQRGNVRVAFSVLYSPMDELSVSGLRQEPASDEVIFSLMEQLGLVETEVAQEPHRAVTVHNRGELNAALAPGQTRTAIVHCVEGGFHLGATTNAVRRNVALLARSGVAYITVAHLLHRQIATCQPAFPFVSDGMFDFLHRQPNVGLGVLGEVMIEEMVKRRIMVDVTHMSERAMRETFTLLDHFDPNRTLPAIASHVGCRIGNLRYNLPDWAIRAVADRKGVCGVILCEHYVRDKVLPKPKTRDESLLQICDHIDRMRATASIDVCAIGSDHDGFIRPALTGFESPSALSGLWQLLEPRYTAADATAICSGNTLRTLLTAW